MDSDLILEHTFPAGSLSSLIDVVENTQESSVNAFIEVIFQEQSLEAFTIPQTQ